MKIMPTKSYDGSHGESGRCATVRAGLRCLALAIVASPCLISVPRTVAEGLAEAARSDDGPGTDLTEEWSALLARQAEIAKEIAEHQAELAKLRSEIDQQVHPGLNRLAAAILEQDPLNADAAEIVVGGLFHENQYPQVMSIVDKLRAAEKVSGTLLLADGIAHFAIEDFTKAQEILQQARSAADSKLFGQLGAPFLAACPAYVSYWQQEQAIRAKEAKQNDLPRVRLVTDRGNIVVELFENEAPNTVANFVHLVETKKYDGVRFHNVVPNFMAQTGDPNTLDGNPKNDGRGGPGYRIPCECYRPDARKHFQGSISMANAGKDTNGSQFFFTHLPTPALNANPKKKTGNTVFGRIIEGLDVALSIKQDDRIESATVVRKRSHRYVPKTVAASVAPGGTISAAR